MTRLHINYTKEEIYQTVSALWKHSGQELKSWQDFRTEFGSLIQECDSCESYKDNDRTYGYIYYLPWADTPEDFCVDFSVFCNVCISVFEKILEEHNTTIALINNGSEIHNLRTMIWEQIND